MVFLTGGTGLLGSHILYDLLLSGESVKVLYRDEKSINTLRKIFEFYNSKNHSSLFDQIIFVKGDILDVDLLMDEIEGCDQVIHSAGFVSFVKKEFSTLMKVNKTGTANVVNACLENNVKKLGYISSTAAIGKFEKKKIYTEKEKWKSDPNISGYSVSKFSAEKEVWRGMVEGLDVYVVNPSIILGPGDWDTTSLKIFKTVNKGLSFYTSGSNNFVDVRDVSKALLFLMENGIKNERFLVAGHHMSYRSLMELIAESLGVKKPKYHAGEFLTGFAWRFEAFKSFFTRKPPLLTKASVKASLENTEYSSEKYLSSCNFEFIGLKGTLNEAADYFKKYYS